MSHPSATLGPVIEWVPFTLASGSTPADLLRAAEQLYDGFLSQQPGFLRRELLQERDGTWVDMLLWRDAADYDAAMMVAGDHPACQAFFAVLAPAQDRAESGPRLLSRVRQWDTVGRS